MNLFQFSAAGTEISIREIRHNFRRLLRTARRYHVAPQAWVKANDIKDQQFRAEALKRLACRRGIFQKTIRQLLEMLADHDSLRNIRNADKIRDLLSGDDILARSLHLALIIGTSTPGPLKSVLAFKERDKNEEGPHIGAAIDLLARFGKPLRGLVIIDKTDLLGDSHLVLFEHENAEHKKELMVYCNGGLMEAVAFFRHWTKIEMDEIEKKPMTGTGTHRLRIENGVIQRRPRLMADALVAAVLEARDRHLKNPQEFSQIDKALAELEMILKQPQPRREVKKYSTFPATGRPAFTDITLPPRQLTASPR